MPQMSRQDPLIENHTVDYVPLAERHGKARDLFTLWFSTNIAPLPIVTGAMVAQVFPAGLEPAQFRSTVLQLVRPRPLGRRRLTTPGPSADQPSVQRP